MKQNINRKQILDLLEAQPEYRQRKYRYIVASRLTDIDPETCKLIASILDDYRHLTEKDSVGAAKEKEWHASPALKRHEQESDRLFNQITFHI